jgi:quercetin dioxygenase-like cupin family protein
VTITPPRLVEPCVGLVHLPAPVRPAESQLLARYLHPAAVDVELGTDELLAIATGLARTAPLQPVATKRGQRAWHLIAASATFEAWVIAWPPGGRIDLHDHGSSAGAVTVTSGELRETTVVNADSDSVRCETKVVRTGEAVTFGAHYVHDFANVGESPAVSVHVYSPRLTSMSYFEFVEGGLALSHIVRFIPGQSVP